MAHLVSLNVGLPKMIGERKGKPVLSGIDKRPVAGRHAMRGVSLDGDGQADLTVHGGPDKAIYAYASEDAAWWAEELGREVGPGMFGENLTTAGMDCSGAIVGEQWAIGDVLLQVCQPRFPCFKLGMHFGDPKMLKSFVQASRPGAYLRILQEGEVEAGDVIELIDRPDHGVTVALVADAVQKDIAFAAEVLKAPQLPLGLADWLRERV